ncbi:hypothetical protein BKI52_10685 [marine bacterium AO1-C]|nr:hypothetical protein BKI52_10685 [marine bacterium AO1-C]
MIDDLNLSFTNTKTSVFELLNSVTGKALAKYNTLHCFARGGGQHREGTGLAGALMPPEATELKTWTRT